MPNTALPLMMTRVRSSTGNRAQVSEEHSMSSTDRQSEITTGGPSWLTTWHEQLLTAVGRWQWLQAVNHRVSAIVQPLYGPDQHHPLAEVLHDRPLLRPAPPPAATGLLVGRMAAS